MFDNTCTDLYHKCMVSEPWRRILSNFFLDGAKILFASFVVGAFLSSAGVSLSFLIGGIVSSGAFLLVSIAFMVFKKQNIQNVHE